MVVISKIKVFQDEDEEIEMVCLIRIDDVFNKLFFLGFVFTHAGKFIS